MATKLIRGLGELRHRWNLRRSTVQLQKLGAAGTPDQAWELMERFSGYGDFGRISAVQSKSELFPLLQLLRKEGVRRACEIGTMNGGTLFMLTRILPDDAEMFSIDWPDAPEHFGRPSSRRKTFYESFSRERQRVVILHGDSHASETRAALVTALRGRPLDFLMIDGDHTYEGVAADFRSYSGLVRNDGLIAFHDIAGDETVTRERCGYSFGVKRLWSELHERYQYWEFIEEQNLQYRWGGGIGVIRWP